MYGQLLSEMMRVARRVMHEIRPSYRNGEKQTPAAAESAVVDPEAELANYDRKIYAAQLDMEASMTAELKGMGVPFFGTDPSLFVENQAESFQREMPSDRPKWSQVVTEAQLLDLRKRMIGHLEDLYRD